MMRMSSAQKAVHVFWAIAETLAHTDVKLALAALYASLAYAFVGEHEIKTRLRICELLLSRLPYATENINEARQQIGKAYMLCKGGQIERQLKVRVCDCAATVALVTGDSRLASEALESAIEIFRLLLQSSMLAEEEDERKNELIELMEERQSTSFRFLWTFVKALKCLYEMEDNIQQSATLLGTLEELLVELGPETLPIHRLLVNLATLLFNIISGDAEKALALFRELETQPLALQQSDLVINGLCLLDLALFPSIMSLIKSLVLHAEVKDGEIAVNGALQALSALQTTSLLCRPLAWLKMICELRRIDLLVIQNRMKDAEQALLHLQIPLDHDVQVAEAIEVRQSFVGLHKSALRDSQATKLGSTASMILAAHAQLSVDLLPSLDTNSPWRLHAAAEYVRALCLYNQSAPPHVVKSALLAALRTANSITHDGQLKCMILALFAAIYGETDFGQAIKMATAAYELAESMDNEVMGLVSSRLLEDSLGKLGGKQPFNPERKMINQKRFTVLSEDSKALMSL